MRDIVDSDIGLSYRPASLCILACRYDNPMPESTLYPLVRDYEFGYWIAKLFVDPHLTAVEAVLSQLFDNRNEKGGADDDNIEQVPQLASEHDEAEAVDLEQDLHDEDGQEAEFEAVQVEKDEDSIEDDNGVEKVAKCPMFDDGFEPGGRGRGVQLWHAKLEYVRLNFDYSNVEEVGCFQKFLLLTDLRRISICDIFQ